MKTKLVCLVFSAILVLSACSEEPSTQSKDETKNVSQNTSALDTAKPVVASVTPVTEANQEDQQTKVVDKVLQQFKEAGLEVEDERLLDDAEMQGMPAKYLEGKRFSLPSFGENAAGRIFLYESRADLDEIDRLFKLFGRSSGPNQRFYTAFNNDTLVFLEIDGRITKEQFEQYKLVLDPSDEGFKITLAEFNQIKEGMTYEEVVKIIGAPGELKNEGGSLSTYRFEGKGSKPLASGVFIFRNGKVESKSQHNLE